MDGTDQPSGDAGNDDIRVVDPTELDVNGERFDPNIHGISADGSPARTKTGAFRRKRGTAGNSGERPARARYTGGAQAERNIPVSSYAGLLVQIHAGVAVMANVPELAISDQEGKVLGQAIAEVQSHYGSVIDPKQEAWIKLTIVAAALYAPRAMAIRQRITETKARKREQVNKTETATLYGDSSQPV